MTSIELFQAGKWKREVPFPTAWDELKPAEMMLMGVALAKNDSRQRLLLDMIAQRARIHGVKLPSGWEALLNFEDATTQGLPLVDALLENNTRTINPLPVLKSLYGPADAFNDLTVGEWEECELVFLQYSKTLDVKYLAELGAMLWRPLSAGRRVPLSGYKVDAKSFSRRVGVASLHVIYLWYCGCRAQLVALFPNVFAGGGKAGAEDAMAITKMIHSGAGPKNGTREQIRAGLIKEFLFDCELAIQQANELKREAKKQLRA